MKTFQASSSSRIQDSNRESFPTYKTLWVSNNFNKRTKKVKTEQQLLLKHQLRSFNNLRTQQQEDYSQKINWMQQKSPESASRESSSWKGPSSHCSPLFRISHQLSQWCQHKSEPQALSPRQLSRLLSWPPA